MTAVPLENGGPGRPLRIVSFGEVLFDIFDDGARLGGAPLNLAVHLHRLGAEPLLVSAVGQDTLGDVAIQEIVREGLAGRPCSPRAAADRQRDGVAQRGEGTGLPLFARLRL